MPLGASILDLLPIPPGTQSAVPTWLRSFLERFTAVDLGSSTTTGATFHYGTLLPTLADTGIQDEIRGWSIEGAGFDRGVRFQLAVTRIVPVPAGSNIEQAPQALQLDLFLEQVSIVLPYLKAARLVPGSGTTPAHLVPDDASSQVRLVGNAILRVTNSTGGGIGGWSGPQLVDFPDPLVPAAPGGAVASMQFVPPHFFVANSAIGLTVRKLSFDASAAYTPADIMARQHGPDWTGLALSEALLYLPRDTPLVGNLVLGVRDVLLGDPFGMQGELRVEWGADGVSATPVQVQQALGSGDADGFGPLTLSATDTALDRTVTFDAGRPLRFFAQVTGGPGTAASVRWILPDGAPATGLVTPEFRARAGDTVVCVRSETADDGSTVDGPEIRHHFSALAAAAAPTITLAVGGQVHANTVHVSGSRDGLVAAGLVFSVEPAPADPETLSWQLGEGSTAPVASGGSFALTSTAGLPAAGAVDLVLTDTASPGAGERRVRLNCLDGASLLVGAQAGVFDAAGAQLAVQAVERTVELNLFHDDGSLVGADQPATGSGLALSVPTNALAQVTVGVGEPVAQEPGRHARVRMVFDEANPSHEGEDIEAVEQLRSDFPGRRFVLIGRCDDVGDAAYNTQLARERAAALRDRLIALGHAAGLIVYRGEQDDPVTGWVGLDGGSVPDLDSLGAPAEQQGDDWFAFEAEPSHPLPNTPEESGDLRARREEYRRVDIYAEGDAAQDAAGPPADGVLAPTLRRAWVPGPDGASPAPPVASSPELIHRVSVRVAWDSPTAATLADFVPTLAEVTVAYESEHLGELADTPLPDSEVGTGSGTGSPVEVLTVTGRWTYDARSGETLFAASVDSTGDPLGLFYIDGDAAALAAAFGPAVVATVSPAFDGAGGVGILGVVAAAAVLQGAVKNGSGRVVCTGLAVEHKQRALDTLAGSQQQLLFDYESAFDVDLNVLNLLQLSTSKPLKIRYRDVGVRLDWSKSDWWEIASFVYEGISMEVVEPGQWQVDGPLGKYLGIQAVRMGTGSTWFEVDMAFNLDLGVVRLTSATIRIVADGGKLAVEIRGLGVALSIPGVLEGSGTARINADGSVAATLAVDVVAAGLSAQAALELKPESAYVAISVKVLLPVGIPLANTGLGIFGFVGQFVSNGARTLIAPIDDDPVQAELDWYQAEFTRKWGPEPGQWALGLGVVIGTLPDMGFTFNAEGMFVVTFPDPSVILGIDAKLLANPGTASDQGGAPPDAEMRLIGLSVIDPTAVMIGVRGTYAIPDVLIVDVPLSAYFPLSGDPRGSYVHLGADNISAEDKVDIFSRAGDPVSMTLLPGVLDANVWAYFMLEERQLHWLGNEEAFSFDGFAVGFGAGWNLIWKAGPLTLDASAQVLVGLGTSPFKLVGGIWVDGLLDAKIASVQVGGSLVAEVIDQGGEIKTHLMGEFCGEIDLPLVPPVKKCIAIEIGDPLIDSTPEPAHPLRAVDLTDRRGNRVALAHDASAATPLPVPTVWPDTVPVLGFSHVPEIGAELAMGWSLAAIPNNPSPWAGSSELKYAFRLDRVDLLVLSGSDFVPVIGPLDAVFWLPTHRGGVMSDDADAIWPSEHEGAALALLSWVPFTVLRHLTNGGEGLPADPVRTLGHVCDTFTIGHETCAPGLDAQALEPGAVRIRSRRGDNDPVAAVFTVFGTTTLGGLSWRELPLALAPLGLHPVAEGIVDLALPVTLPDGRTVRRGWELPGIGQAGPRYASLGWEGRFEPAIASGQVLLEVCDQGYGVGGGTRCFPFDDVDKVNDVDRWDSAGLRVVKTVTPPGATRLVGSADLLVLGSGTVRLILPFPASTVALAFAHPLGVATMVIKGLRGAVLDTRVIPRGTGVEVELTDLGPIAEIVIVSLDRRLGLSAVCVRAGLGPLDGPLEAPPLVGQRVDGSLAFWTAETQVDQTLADGRRCLQVMYTAPDAGGWQAVGVPAMQSATIRLVGVCGLTTTLEQVRLRDQAARDTLKDGWNINAGQTSLTRPLLAADSTYRLRVGVSWAGWRPASPGAMPPATVADDDWQALTDVEIDFHTAAESIDAMSSPPQVSLTDESGFDPRAVARYLIGFEPATADAPPHLLADALLAHFEVDHVEQLLAAFARTLAFTLRRTDPPAGSIVAGPLPVIALDLQRSALEATRLDSVDARVITAVRADPRCLATDVNTGGVTLAIQADLEPNAEYDLMLFAPPADAPLDESLLVARTHFRSSRYADVDTLLQSLGFGAAGGAAASFIPFDFVVSNAAAMPAADAVASDAALDDALRTLGMDPWALVGIGRTVAIWRLGAAAGEYLLAGLLLESPEAIERGERCGVVQASVDADAATVVLTPVRINRAGTRVLLATADPLGQALAGTTLTLALQLRDRLLTRTGTRTLRALPRIAYQELP